MSLRKYSLSEQALFVYGTGLAVTIHLALVYGVIFRTWAAIPISLVGWLLTCTATLAMWRWVYPRTGELLPRRRWAVQTGIAILVFTALQAFLSEGRALLTHSPSLLSLYDGGDKTVTIPAAMFRWGPLIFASIPIIPTALLCVFGFNLHWWRIFELQRRERELRELAVSSQLAALRAQVNPHFFFNSLNSIAQLITSDPEKAERCVERLADIYRYILGRTQAEFVSLADELQVAEAYLEIEKARFGDDLTVEEDVEECARDVRLPGLILQPLVENAVRHGISRKIGGGTVSIRADIDAGHLRLVVRDSGMGMQEVATAFERGVGLRNVHDRLVNLYGPEYVPVLESRPGEGTAVTLRIPVLPIGTA
jgi:signal transduction histidine kinase